MADWAARKRAKMASARDKKESKEKEKERKRTTMVPRSGMMRWQIGPHASGRRWRVRATRRRARRRRRRGRRARRRRRRGRRKTKRSESVLRAGLKTTMTAAGTTPPSPCTRRGGPGVLRKPMLEETQTQARRWGLRGLRVVMVVMRGVTTT